MTPEQREVLRVRIEASREMTTRVKKLKAVKSHAVRSHALAQEALNQMSSASVATPVAFQEVSSRWKSAQQASEARQSRVLHRLTAPRREEESVRAEAEESDENEDEAVAEVAQLVGAAPEALSAPSAAARAGGAVASVEAHQAQLRVEPKAEEECAAKFMLYEGYAQEVEKIRKALFDFFEENSPTLPPAVAQEMGRQLRKVDSHEAMGVPDDDGRTWFVYHMMRQAERNNCAMASVLEGFQKKLEHLAKNDQTECPICLEAFAEEGAAGGGGRAAETLSCCHKLCQECWAHWKQVRQGHVFCPLCRHEEFLSAVSSAAMDF